jgi:hypothetical protein
MVKEKDNFYFEFIFPDGRKLELKFENCCLAEHFILLKIFKKTVDSINAYQRFLLVENFIKESMQKLKCKNRG